MKNAPERVRQAAGRTQIERIEFELSLNPIAAALEIRDLVETGRLSKTSVKPLFYWRISCRKTLTKDWRCNRRWPNHCSMMPKCNPCMLPTQCCMALWKMRAN